MSEWARADTGGMFGGGSRAPSMRVLPRADSVAGGGGGSRLGGRGGGAAGGMNRPGTASLGPVPRRPPSIMPVMRAQVATGAAARAAAVGPLPPAGKISAHAFRVEKKGTYQGELNVPSILFIGKAGEPSDPTPAKQKMAELSKYKLRPGALEELGIEEGIEEEDEMGGASALPKAGGTTSPLRLDGKKKSVSYDMAPYGGKREMESLRKQIVETETAALESRLQSQSVVSKTQATVAMVEEKVGHVRESNQQLDSELVEIEKQIEELKRISRAQIDEIKALRDTNKLKESKFQEEQQELMRMEVTAARRGGAWADAYSGDKGEGVGEHEELDALLELCDDLEDIDGRVWAQAGERTVEEQQFLTEHPSEDFLDVPPWLALSKPPTDWEDANGSRKLGLGPAEPAPPQTNLEIEHVYGYSGSSSLDSLCCTATGKLIYPAALLCIIHDLAYGRQRFFSGHDDGVLCVALHPGGQLVASGDVGKSSKVLVWDSEAPELPALASLWGFHKAGIATVAFSRDGNQLVTVGRDVDHSLCLWDWRKEAKLVSCKTGANPVLSVRFDPVSSVVITAGVRHLKFWSVVDTQFQVLLADLNHKGSLQTFLSIAFMYVRNKEGQAPCTTLTGMQDGCLYLWNSTGQLFHSEKKAHAGPISIIVCPRQGEQECGTFALTGGADECGTFALTGGADGKVRRWDAHVSNGLVPLWTIDLEEKTRTLSSVFGGKRSPIRGIACSADGLIYAGTVHNEIYQFTPEPVLPGKPARAPDATMLVMQAHSQGAVSALDVHPLRHEFVTVAWDSTLRIWSTGSHVCTRAVQLTDFEEGRVTATAVAYSPDGEQLSVGFEDGQVWVLDASAIAAFEETLCKDVSKIAVKDDDDEPLKFEAEKKGLTPGGGAKGKAISGLRYRPDGLLLVAAAIGGKVFLFRVPGEDGENNSYERIKTIVVSVNANIRSLDFSEDCKLLRTTNTANQILYWSVEETGPDDDISGAPVKDTGALADVVWATWGSALGWQVEGIYETGHYGLHSRTSALASREQHLLVAWQDKDLLLYNLPCRSGAKPRRFKAHASVPSQVHFLHDDRGIVSAGSKWRPAGAGARAAKTDDEEVRALVGRCSRIRREGLVVKMILEEDSALACSSVLSSTEWKNTSTELADLLKVDVGRFELIRAMGGSLVFEIAILPDPLGWHVAPTAAQVLSRLQKVFENGMLARKIQKLTDDGLQVVHLGEEVDEDVGMGDTPWLGLVCAPSDWKPTLGSEILNYAPTLTCKAVQGHKGVEELPVASDLCLVAYPQELNSVINVEGGAASSALLTLEYVHGYQGWGGGNNLFYFDSQHLVYSAGKYGVMHNVSASTQAFMVGHTDQIACMAKQVEELPVPKGSKAGGKWCWFATGELGERGAIRVWRTAAASAPSEAFCLQGFHNCDVVAICFMKGGSLVSVGSDAQHQVAVWDIGKKTLKTSSRGDVNAILAVSSAGHGNFVTVGVIHIKFWKLAADAEDEGDEKLMARGGIFGNKGQAQTMQCVQSFFEMSHEREVLVTMTGTEDGSIYVWKDNLLWFNMRQVHRGPVFSCGLADLGDSQQGLVTGGKEGAVIITSYHITEGLTKLCVLDTTTLKMTPSLMVSRRSIRAVAVSTAGDGWLRLAFGTASNDVVQIEMDARNKSDIKVLHHSLCSVVHGHGGASLLGLCAHPDFAEFATVGDDCIVRLWHATRHHLKACLHIGSEGTSIDYNVGKDQHLAIGLVQGGLVVLDAARMRQAHTYEECLVAKLTHRRARITDVKYSPDGEYLAVASCDNVIDICMVKNKYTRWGVCRGHRHITIHVDWSMDSRMIRSNDCSQELLFFNVHTMRRGEIAALEGAHEYNDVAWSTATCHMTWATQGTCASYASISDIAAVDRSHNGALLACADGFGNVRLFRYPSLDGGLNYRRSAHAGAVTNVKFTFDDSSLLSICSDDMCLVQWKVGLVPTTVDTDVAHLLQSPHHSPAEGSAVEDEAEPSDALELFKPFLAGVFAPSIWTGTGKQVDWKADESMYSVPTQELELERLHGCRGHDRHAHVCFNHLFHAVYYTAKVVVVQDREYGLQRFFLGHSEDISCIAPHHLGRLFASAQSGTTALICVWDSQRQEVQSVQGRRQRSLKQLAAFKALDAKGVVAMAFVSQGDLLVTVSDNEGHHVTLWDWQRGVSLSVAKGSMNRTLAVASSRFRAAPDGAECFVTCGVKHVHFWEIVNGKLVGRNGDLSSKGILSIQLSCAFSKNFCVTGNQEGCIYVWKDARLETTVKAHKGPIFALHTAAHQSEGAPVFCSAGGDGVIKLWTIKMAVENAKPPSSSQPETLGRVIEQESGIEQEEVGRKDVGGWSKQWAVKGKNLGMYEIRCFASQGISIESLVKGLNVPSTDQGVSVRAAYLQFEPALKTISSDGVWRILVGTSLNEVYQLTLPQLISAPNEMTTEVPLEGASQFERETVKVYVSVVYGDEGVGTRKLRALEILVQGHTPPWPPLLQLSSNEAPEGSESEVIASSESHTFAAAAAAAERAAAAAAGGFGCMLRALAVHPHDEKEYATCGSDGVLRIWDAHQPHESVSFMSRLPEMVASMSYSPDCFGTYHLALGCYGKILIIDASVPLEVPLKNSAICTLEGKIQTSTGSEHCGVASGDLVTCLKYSLHCSRSSKSCYLAAGLSSGCIVLYNAPITPKCQYEKVAKFKGHTGAVLHIDFSKQPGGDSEYLQSNCARFELRFWEIRSRKERKVPSELRDEMWESVTCSLSWAALGIRPDNYPAVPAVCRSPDHPCMVGGIWPDSVPLLAVSGLEGQVTLTRYPCLERAMTKQWPSHSTPASGIRFTHGAQRVISIGDTDMAVFQWRRQLPLHPDLDHILEVPSTMKARIGDANALFLAKDHGSHDAAAGTQLGTQAAFDDAKPFLQIAKMLKKCGWDDFHPDDLTRADRQELSRYDLKLNHIHGARGHCGLNTVHLNEKGHAVYAAASVVIVQDGDKQLHHFQGHDDDVLCIAMSDDCLLAATGQVGDKGAVCIWLWNTVEYTREGRIDFPRDGGIYALSFSPMVGDENVPLFLASIANDEDCTIDIWDMREGMRNIKLLTSIAGDTTRILSIAWNPFHQDEALGSLVTCGDKHLQFWTFAQEARSEEDLAASDGREAAVHIIRHQPSWKDTTKQTALCISFLQNTVAEPEPDDKSPHGYTLTGMQDGSIFLWKWHPDDGSVFVIKVLPAQHDGPIFTLCTKGNYVLTGGNDGFVKIWNLKSFGDGAPAQKQIHLSTEGYSNRSNGSCVSKILPPSVRSLCAQLEKKKEEEEGDEGGRGDADNLIILAATASNEIYEMMLTANSVRRSRIIVQSHGGRNLQALATHPVKDWFATTGDDCVVRMWNLATRSCSHAALITDANGNKVAGTAVAFRGKVDRPIHTEQCPVCKYGTVEKERQFHCDELAVGTARGDVVIYRQDVDGQLSECTRKQYRSKAITCLQYAPSGTLLAVASEEMVIDILLPDENHRRVGVCKGHNSPISSIDWSMDGEYMQSGDTALDLIFWAMKTQVRTSSSAAPPAPEHKATTVKSDKHVAEFEAYSKPILLYKRRWASNTTPLGWAWLGIYNLGSEAVGLNAVDCFILDRKEKKGLGVSADVTGAIKLFPYPNHATQGRQFLAHSAGVRKVCFSASGKYVVSVGGRDCCAMQWEVVPPTSDDAVVVTVARTDDDSDDDELDLLRAAPSQSPGKKKK